MDQKNKHCNRLISYFTKNNKYDYERSNYETEEGMKLRADWCQFLNRSRLLRVKLEDRYEVAATVPNLLLFFRSYFPRLQVPYAELVQLTYQSILTKELFNSYEKLLNIIYAQLSPNFSMSMKLQSSIIYQKEFIYFNTIQHIYLDGHHRLDW